MAPPNEPKTGIEREIDLLWKQGINVLREDVKNLADSIASTRRWAVGLLVVALPAYAAAIIGFIRK